ncbi:phosphoadenosine phosphosulfate sulfotransferase [Lysinibacillus sp. NPDC048646]|uniref:phosphoadenosine phosphosulfate sulfotransferase n=1 Tax=Lysinibacillus sp. NPDC048646 TaxID=3390574 RepID=UPI003D0194DF
MSFNKIGILIIFLSLSFLSSCAGQTFLFTGESDNWSIRYEVEKAKSCQPTTGAIKYIGKEPMPKRLEYSYERASGDSPLNEYGVVTLAKGCTYAVEDSEIEVILKWDNQTETVPLTVK